MNVANWQFDFTTTNAVGEFAFWNSPGSLTTTWYASTGATTERRKRSAALPVAIGHAAFFLALALTGWLR